MSTEIDKRVVEMQFNNKDFEKNAQASLTTIEKLKMALNFDGAKGLESLTKAANKVDLSNISKSADAVAVKFSAMQIAGVTAIQQLTLSFLNFGKNLWNNSLGQIKSGGMARALKIEQANFQMRALANNMYDVEKEADKIESLLTGMADAIDRSVTGTAYGYDAAASVASQLMASGLRDSEKMYEHLRAIAGAAAMTGRDFENIGDIFTKVSSNGRLMTMELRQFAAAGLNMSSVLADYYGTTEQAVNDMVHDGKVSFEDFSEAVYKAFGEMAGKADETFSGVSKNVKAQLSRIGQLFAQPYIKNMIPFLQTVKAKLKEINTALAPIANTFDYVFGKIMTSATESLKKLDLFRLNTIFDGIKNVLTSIFLIAVQIKRAFDEVFPKKTLDELHELAIEFNNITLALIPGPDTLNGLKELVKFPLSLVKVVLKAFKSVLKGVRPVISAFKNLMGAVARFGEVFTTLNQAIIDGTKQTSILETVFVAVGTAIGYVINLISTLVDVIRLLLTKMFNSTLFQQFLGFIASVIDGIQRIISVIMYLALSVISYIFSKLDFDHIINALKEVKNVFTVIFGFISRVVNYILLFIISIVTGVSSIGKGISVIFDYFKSGVAKVKKFFSNIKKGGEESTNAIDNLLEAFGRIKDRFDHLFEGLTAGKVLLIAFSVGVILLIFSLEKLIRNLADLAKHADVAFGIFDILKNGLAKAIQISPMLQVLIGIAVAIGAVTASLITLGKDLTSEELQRSVAALATFMGILVLISALILEIGKKMPNNITTVKEVISSIGSFSIGILGLALAIKILSGLNIDFKNLIVSLTAITVLIGELAAVAYILTTNVHKIDKEKEQLKTVSVNFIGLALAVLLLTNAFKILSKVDPDKLLQSMSSLIVIMSLLTVVIYVAGEAGQKGLNFKTGLGISLIVGTLTSLLIDMLILSLIPLDTLAMSLVKMLAVMSPLLAFIVVLGELVLKGDKLSKSRNIEVLTAMRKILSVFALTMAEMTIIVGILGKMPLGNLLKGVAAVSVMSYLIQLVVAKFITVSDQLFKKFGSTNEGYKNFNASLQSIAKMIAAFAAIMLSLSISAVMFDKASIIGFGEAILAFYLVINTMERVIAAAEKTKDAKLAPLLGLAVSMLAIMAAVAMIVFAFSGEKAFENASLFLAVSIGFLAILRGIAFVVSAIGNKGYTRPKITKTVYKGAKNTELLVISLSAMILAIASIGLLFSKIQNEDQIKGALYFTAELVVAMGIVLLAILELSKTKKGASIGEAAELLKAQEPLFKAIAKFILSVAALVAVVSASTAGLAALTKGDPTNIIVHAIVVLLALVGSIAAVTYILIPQLKKLAEQAAEKEEFKESFESMISLITTLVYGIVGIVAAVGAVASLVSLTKSLDHFTMGLVLVAVTLISLIGPIISIIEQLRSLDQDKFDNVIDLLNSVRYFMTDILKSISLLLGVMAVSVAVNNYGSVNTFGMVVNSTIGIILGLWGMILSFSYLLGEKDIKILDSLNKFILAFASSVAIISAAIAGMALAFNYTYGGAITGAIVAMVAIVGVLVGSVILLSHAISSNDLAPLLDACLAVAILTTGVISIAFAMKMLYDTLTNDVGTNALAKLGKIFGSFIMIMISLVASTAVVIALAKNLPTGKVVDLAMVSLLVATIAACVVAIAGAIKIMDGVNIGPGAAASFISMGAIIAIIVSLVTGLSKNANWAVLGSAALLVASFGATAIAMAVTIKMLVAAFSGISKEQMSNIVLVFIAFEVIVGLLVGIFGVLGAAIGENAMAVSLLIASFAGAVASFGLSAILFGAGVTLFAEGVNRLFEVIQTINDLHLDGQKIRENIKQGIMGIAQGIWDSLGYIAQALTGIVITILEVAVASVAVIAGIAAILMTGFAMGLIMALPVLLVAVTAILAAIAEWGKEEENIQLLYDAGYTLGQAIVAGIMGAFDGLKDELLKRITDSIPSLDTLKEYIEAKIFNKQLKDEGYMEDENGILRKPRGSHLKSSAGIRDDGTKADSITKTESSKSDDPNVIKKNEHNNRKAQKYVNDLIKNYKEYKKTQDEANKSTREAALEARAASHATMEYSESVGMMASTNDKVYVHTKSNLQGVSEEGNNLIDTLDNVGNAMENSSDKTNIFSRGLETVKESVKENGTEIATEAGGNLLKSVGDDLVNEYAPDILVKLKNKFGDLNIDWDLVNDVITGKVDKSELFKSFFNNGLFASLGFKDGISSGLSDLAAMFNIDLSSVKTYEEWESYGNEKAYYGGHVERWKAQGYSSAAAFADDMQKKYGTYGDALMKAFFGDSDPLSNAVDSMSDAASKMTDSLNGLGEEEDEVAKKTNALADSVSNALDIFSEFNDTAEMTGHDVLKSFMSQITGVSKWSTELKALAGKGFSQALLEDLANLGPQGYEKVHALYTMSAKEMSLFNKMYAKKLSLESSTATDILASFHGNAADIAEVYSEELTEQMQNAASEGVKNVGEGIVSEMAAIPEQAGTAIGEAAFPLTNAFAELGMSSMEAFKKQMDFEEALEAVKVFQAGIINSTTLGSKLFDELSESEEISSKKMLDNMKRQVMNVGEWVSEINTLVARGASEGLVNQLMEMGPEGKAKVDAFVKMTDSELKEANRLYEASAKLPQVSADRITKSYAQAGYNASLGFTEGIDPEAAQNAMYMLAEHSLEYLEAALEINSPSKKTEKIGVYTVEGFIAGIINETSKYKLRNACASITTIIKDSFKNNLSASTFRSIADDCMAGLANGIMASATDAAIKAAEAAKKVTEAVKNAFDTHSPSLIFKWIGEMLMLGLGDGIIEQGDTTAETAALTAKNVIDNVMAKIASMSEYDEQAYTPVIRPVIDTSNVDQGYNDIRSWFDQQGSISMMGNIRLNTNNENGSSDVNRIVDAINGISNKDVVDEIASLRNDISTLQDSMSRLQVVMDTGSLVGQLVQPMDQALGVRAVTNSRGRYS